MGGKDCVNPARSVRGCDEVFHASPVSYDPVASQAGINDISLAGSVSGTTSTGSDGRSN
jgi:hypothetical protein